MTKLGIIGAMDVEVETLLSEMEQVASTKKAGSTFHEGVLMGLPVVLVQCGVGKVNAALCVQIMCDCFDVTHLVNTGIAGSLCAELDIGDLVVSRDAMYHDFDCTHFGYPFGKVPGMDVIAFPADDTLRIRGGGGGESGSHPGGQSRQRRPVRSRPGGEGKNRRKHPGTVYGNGGRGHRPDGLPQQRSLRHPPRHLRQSGRQRGNGLSHI